MNESRISPEGRTPEDDRLDALFAAYRSACEPREVSANFTPELWQRIERAQAVTFSFRRVARGFATAAAALSLAMAMFAFVPFHEFSPVYNVTYVEALAANSDALTAAASTDSTDLVRPDVADEAEEI
jgi:hypothetical protein